MRKTKLTILKWVLTPVAIMTFVILYKSQQAPNDDNVLDIAIARAPLTFDATLATDATSVRLLKLLSKGLITRDASFNPQPAAASSFNFSERGTYRFTLNAIFEDGEKLTSEHVKNFYKKIMADESRSPFKQLLNNVINIETPSSDVVVFKMQGESPYVTSIFEIPLQKKCIKNTIKVCGLGGFYVDDYKEGAYISLGKKGTSNHEIWKFHFVKDPVVRLLKALKGDIDVVHNDMPVELAKYAEKRQMRVKYQPSASYTYIGFNFIESTATAHPYVRKAIAHAIDRDEIINGLLGGAATPAYSLLMPNHKAYLQRDYPAKNLSKALKYMNKLGYGPHEGQERLTLSLSTTTNPFVLRVAQVLQQQLKPIGIDLKVLSSEWGTFYGNIKRGNFELFVLTWVGRFDIDIYNTLFYSKNAPPMGANRGKYANNAMDQSLKTVMSSPDIQERYVAARHIQELQSNELIYLPLWRRDHSLIMSENIFGCTIDPEGNYIGLLQCRNNGATK